MSYIAVPTRESTASPSSCAQDHDFPSQKSRRPTISLCTAILLIFPIAICCTAVGAIAGYRYGASSAITTATGRLAPAGSITTVPIYNHTFSDPPTIASERAWNDLAPIGGGFVVHPVAAPQEAAVAVFHQLHCLHGIRLSLYYALAKTNATLKEEIGDQMDQYGLHDLQHTVHCFDYIRQALMCAADSNLEPLNATSHHVDAFGGEKQCRDLDTLTSWAIQWRSSNRTGIRTKQQLPAILAGGTSGE